MTSAILFILILIALSVLLYVEFFVKKLKLTNRQWVADITKKYEKIISDPDSSKDDLLDLRYEIKENYQYHVFDIELTSLVLNLLIKIDRKLDKLSV